VHVRLRRVASAEDRLSDPTTSRMWLSQWSRIFGCHGNA
jgi:hypothetical protein